MKLDLTKPLVYRKNGKDYHLFFQEYKKDGIDMMYYTDENNACNFIHIKENGYEYVYDINKEKYVRKSHSQVVRNVEDVDVVKETLELVKVMYEKEKERAIRWGNKYDESCEKLKELAIAFKEVDEANDRLVEENDALKEQVEKLSANLKSTSDQMHLLVGKFRQEKQDLERQVKYRIKSEKIRQEMVEKLQNQIVELEENNLLLREVNYSQNEEIRQLHASCNRTIAEKELLQTNSDERIKVLLEQSNEQYEMYCEVIGTLLDASKYMVHHPFKSIWKILRKEEIIKYIFAKEENKVKP
jgi:DNA repair exonuclease SbcCD ATPase subunit